MYTKIMALVIQTYLFIKSVTPPNQNLPTKKVMSTEGVMGMFIAKFGPKISIIIAVAQSSIYIFIMYQQEIGSIPIINHKFSDWNLLEVVSFSCIIGGSLLRLWCFKCLKEFFTFNVTIKKDHKLITTGPYSILVHPSVSILFYLFIFYSN